MSLTTIIFIALALAMDAFAVSIASGVAIKQMRLRHALTIAAWFGVFQALMPVLGWLAGAGARQWVARIDHWIVFGLLCFIGSKMIYESFKIEKIEKKTDPLSIYVIFGLSIATSIDAFGAGISFAMLDVAIITPALVIGGITFLTSFIGMYIGETGAHFFESKIEIAAGIVLIAIGIKVLIAGVL